MKRLISIALMLVITAVFAAGCAGEEQNPPEQPTYYRVAVDGGSGTGDYAEGFICTAKAEVPSGKQFIKWIQNGREASVNAEYSFNVREDTWLIAVFDDIPDNAGKEVCFVRVDGGVGSGGYIKGGKCTVSVSKNYANREFAGWARVEDGVEGDIVSTDRSYTFDVTENIELKAKFSKCYLTAPDNSKDMMFGLIAGQGYIPFDRQIDSATGETYTAFTEGVAYILLWVYTSNADDAEPIGAFKMVSEKGENGVAHGYICTSDYAETVDEDGNKTVTGKKIDFLGVPGAYYTPDGNTHNMLKDGISKMKGGSYSTSVAYYFATQAIGIETAEGEMAYVDSPISGKGSPIINM